MNDYLCLCTDGWDGRNCERDVDDCVNNQCINGATCLVSSTILFYSYHFRRIINALRMFVLYMTLYIISYHPLSIINNRLVICRICSGDTIAVVLMVTMGNTVRRKWTSVCRARA